jgi:hypothetical protein
VKISKKKLRKIILKEVDENIKEFLAGAVDRMIKDPKMRLDIKDDKHLCFVLSLLEGNKQIKVLKTGNVFAIGAKIKGESPDKVYEEECEPVPIVEELIIKEIAEILIKEFDFGGIAREGAYTAAEMALSTAGVSGVTREQLEAFVKLWCNEQIRDFMIQNTDVRSFRQMLKSFLDTKGEPLKSLSGAVDLVPDEVFSVAKELLENPTVKTAMQTLCNQLVGD